MFGLMTTLAPGLTNRLIPPSESTAARVMAAGSSPRDITKSGVSAASDFPTPRMADGPGAKVAAVSDQTAFKKISAVRFLHHYSLSSLSKTLES